jgi:chromosome partitioning protein
MRRYHNLRVLVVDTDYQRGGLTCRLIPEMLENFRRGEVDTNSIYHCYRALYSDQKELPVINVLPTRIGLDLIPADPRLNTISADKLPSWRNIRDNNRMLLKHLTLIGDSISVFSNNYDYVLIDSHPDLHDLEKSVICACDFIVSPVKLDQQSAIGVPSTQEAIRSVNDDVKTVISTADPERKYIDTQFLGAIGMMCREWGETLKETDQNQCSN